MPFQPSPDQTFEFNGRSFRFVQHKVARDPMVHAETGARATVYLAMHGHDPWALKVFRPRFRKPHQAEVVTRLTGLRGMPGLRVAHRDVVLPGNPLAVAHRELEYAQLMPWVSGVPWANILTFGVQRNQCFLNPAHAFELCSRFLSTMQELERRTIAHTDIASGNVLVDPDALSIELIDLEEMYGPGFPEPGQKNVGSAGYTHPAVKASGAGLWFAEADRFAATILAAEMLVLAHPELAQRADHGGGYFDNDEFGRRTDRFLATYDYLHHVMPDFAEAFARAWNAPALGDCPRAEELVQAFARRGAAVPSPSGPALVPVGQTPAWTPPVTVRRTSSQPSSTNAQATASTAPADDQGVVVEWRPLGPQVASVRPGMVDAMGAPTTPWTPAATGSSPPGMGASVVSSRPALPSPAVLFEWRDFSVHTHAIGHRGAWVAPQQIVQVAVERRLGGKDVLMAALLAGFASLLGVALLTDRGDVAIVAGSLLLGAVFIYLGIGVGRAVLTLWFGRGAPEAIELPTRAMAEKAADAVRRAAGL